MERVEYLSERSRIGHITGQRKHTTSSWVKVKIPLGKGKDSRYGSEEEVILGNSVKIFKTAFSRFAFERDTIET